MPLLHILSSRPIRLKPVSKITDRAKRYRANADAPKQANCFACGRPRPRVVHHVDGNESNGDVKNLTRACHSCNGKVAAIMRRVGLGKPTRQFNPKHRGRSKTSSGARSLGEYLSAIAILKGEQTGNVASAVRTVKETTPHRRSEFAAKIWQIRRERYGKSGRQQEIPF